MDNFVYTRECPICKRELKKKDPPSHGDAFAGGNTKKIKTIRRNSKMKKVLMSPLFGIMILLTLTCIAYAEETVGGSPVVSSNMLGLVTEIYTIVGMAKRFIPDPLRTWVNPIMSVALGIGLSFLSGGSAGIPTVILNGLIGAGTAMGTYSVPKYIGKEMGTQ